MKKPRKTRVTKDLIHQMQEENKIKAKKNVIIPGPWTNLATDIIVAPELRITNGMIGKIIGSYATNDDQWKEKGWYAISVNVTSNNIYADVQKNGIDQYLAAWEKAMKAEIFTKKYGTMILLKIGVDHSL